MAEDTKLTATLTAAQWDFIGRQVVDVLNASSAQARMAQSIWKDLQAQLQPQPMPVQAKPNGLHAVPSEAAQAVVDSPAVPSP
jgi:hypothetical protein